ncbi:hypothetical protein AADX85_14240, partial [Staphylococcus epidermidis]
TSHAKAAADFQGQGAYEETMKLWRWLALAALPIIMLGMLFFTVIASDDEEDPPNSALTTDAMSLSAAVLKHRLTVEKYCREFGITDQVMV